MLFMLNIDGLIINHINLNDQINKWVMCVELCYPIINGIMFEFVNFDTIIIRVVFGVVNTIEHLYVDMTRTRHANKNYHPYIYQLSQASRATFFSTLREQRCKWRKTTKIVSSAHNVGITRFEPKRSSRL